jgi:hypothetical protein
VPEIRIVAAFSNSRRRWNPLDDRNRRSFVAACR